jgi:hypothetical protein
VRAKRAQRENERKSSARNSTTRAPARKLTSKLSPVLLCRYEQGGDEPEITGCDARIERGDGRFEEVELFDRMELDILGLCSGGNTLGEIADMLGEGEEEEEGGSKEEVWRDVVCRVERLHGLMLVWKA